jgi:predicted extracellular nuclease
MKKYYFLFFLVLLYSCSEDDASIPEDLPEENNFSTEIFFSEYVEGTSFNKALEIVNLTGENIDLEVEVYSIKKQSNGAGDWMGQVFLEGKLEHNETFVISNESADISEITSKANQLKTGAPLDFNGNDPIGLFKNGELIDVIGEPDNPDDFAKDQTLGRKKTLTEPSLEFNPEHWNFLEMNTVEGLGSY